MTGCSVFLAILGAIFIALFGFGVMCSVIALVDELIAIIWGRSR